MIHLNYNERSWAIDVISEINLYLANKSKKIKGAGGENTIKNKRQNLFPDVLLYGDHSRGEILQGWELKMPDTAITDTELFQNATLKARILHLNSFVLWNVKNAVLYQRVGERFELLKAWEAIDVHSREEVAQKSELWKSLLHQIIEDLNGFFNSGELQEVKLLEALSINSFIDLILENTDNTATAIRQSIVADPQLDATINQWWRSSANEYTDKQAKYPTLSRVVLTDWVIKIVFAHILKRYFDEAARIEQIGFETEVSEAIALIAGISEQCNFWNIFQHHLAQEAISELAWNQLVQLNAFLTDINIAHIDITLLHQLLQTSIASAKRRAAGQFSTPPKLADILVRLTVDDKSKKILDPCCGTGTIIQRAYALKEEYGLPQENILQTIWASDKYAFPLQLATLTLTQPENIGQVLQVFREDVVLLEEGKTIPFKDPHSGDMIHKAFPPIDYVVSNLPFIQHEDIRHLNPDIFAINDWIHQHSHATVSLGGKSDIYVYLPFCLHRILAEGGKIGLILSNAWMGTKYGEAFIELLQWFYEIEKIVISGKGRWFANAEVVTTLLIARKKTLPNAPAHNAAVAFCTIREPLENIGEPKDLAEQLILGNNTEQVAIHTYEQEQIRFLEQLGIPWSSYFSDLNWLPSILDRLVEASAIFDFKRGERRGWNPLFYPAEPHSIEAEYLQPVLKNLRGVSSLLCSPQHMAFCCSRTLDELTALGHNGALEWIRSFEHQTNNKGTPLPQALQRPNLHWYEMKADTLADFVANINYDKSLFIAQLENRAFVDQRLIGFSVKPAYQSEDPLLLLALFNTVLSLFFIECLGFGRGLAALDLSKNKVEAGFRLLRFEQLSLWDKQRIINLFHPISQRERLPLEEELQQEDRLRFERTLFEIFGIAEYYESVCHSLLQLYRIRFAVQ